MQEHPKQGEGEIHKRLVRNECPKCMKPLETVRKTETQLIRRCDSCLLTISDDPKTAECPDNARDQVLDLPRPPQGHFYKESTMDKAFVEGLMAKKPSDKAPDWVKCAISIRREELLAWLSTQDEEWINAQICESKSGKWYAEVNTWKPTSPMPSR